MARLFGTDGLRGIAGQFPLDQATLELLGRILYFQFLERKMDPELIIGRDTRESGPVLFSAISRGFGRAGGQIDDAGILSTPALAYLALSEKKCAISITASHNPYKDNGIKIIGPDGSKLSEDAEMEIEPYLLGEKTFRQESASFPEVQNRAMHGFFKTKYCLHLRELFADLDLRGLRIALDCANGALSEIAPQVLREFGAEVTPYHNEPDGKNINENSGSLHPDLFFETVRAGNFDCGFTFDGDGDRCLAADPQALYDGDFILGAAARYLQKRNELKHNAVVATSMSNLGLELFLKKHNIHLHRVPVGDKSVLEKLRQEDLSLGGEQSGHIIFMNDSFIGDGLLTALQLLRIYRDWDGFSHICEGLVKCPQILLNIPVKKKPEFETIPEIQEKVEVIEKELQDSGRILLRYSGTEMLARIMIEGTDQNRIEGMAKDLGEIISRSLN